MKNKSKITITSPARLHLGFMDLNGSLGRKFGSVGLAINSVETSVTVSKNSMQNENEIDDSNKRAYVYANLILKAYEVDESVTIIVHKKIPEHAGLGSGTQLALTIGVAISKLFDLNLSFGLHIYRISVLRPYHAEQTIWQLRYPIDLVFYL